MERTEQIKLTTESLAPVEKVKPRILHQLKLSRRVRKKTGAALEYAWELSASARHPKADVAILEGPAKFTKLNLRVLYIGGYENYAFILNLLYDDFKIVEKHAGICSINSAKWMHRYKKQVDLIFLDLELLYCKLFNRGNWLAIPQWIRQYLNVPDSWEEVLGQFRKNTKKTDLRKVRKYGFTYRITRSENDYEQFYEEMYKPYLTKRFHSEVIIEPKWKVLRQCRKGELMQIIREDEVVSAVLLHQSEGRLAYVWVGVPEHIDGGMQKGAFSALFYYTIVYGYNHGCHEVDFLGSRPLLNDGLFLYKRKWGAQVKDSPVPRGDILLRPMNINKAVQGIFAHNYFIVRRGRALSGKLLIEGDPLKKNELQKISARYFTRGLQGLYIYCLNGYRQDAWDWAQEQKDRIVIVDLKLESNPAAVFCSS